jgi:hypothetical protein
MIAVATNRVNSRWFLRPPAPGQASPDLHDDGAGRTYSMRIKE